MASRWWNPEHELQLAHILAYSVAGAAVVWPFALSESVWMTLGKLVVYSLACGEMIHLLHLGVSRLASGLIGRATGASIGGTDTRQHFGMSAVDALIVNGRHDEAIAQLRAAMYAHDGHTGAEIAQRLGDLLLRIGTPEDAAQAYRRARRLWETVHGAPGREGRTYATRRLLDLYEGPLANAAAADRERDRLRAA
jgi:hypothetical protein